MARFSERLVGVFDSDTGRVIGNHDPEWPEYQGWLAAGNEPDAQAAPAPVPVSARRARAGQDINELRSEKLAQATVNYGGHTWDADARSLQNLIAVIVGTGAGIPLPDGFVWRTADNSSVPVTPTDLLGIGAAVQARITEIYRESWRLKDEVIAINDAPETLDIRGLWKT